MAVACLCSLSFLLPCHSCTDHHDAMDMEHGYHILWSCHDNIGLQIIIMPWFENIRKRLMTEFIIKTKSLPASG